MVKILQHVGHPCVSALSAYTPSSNHVPLQLQSPAASVVMRRSIQGMLEELEYNLWEHILHRLVDYGHTFSPEIEMAALNGDEAMLLHGEAVNIDMALTTQVRLML